MAPIFKSNTAIVLLCAATPFATFGRAAGEDPTVVEITNAWRARANQVTSGRFVWNETQTMAVADDELIPHPGRPNPRAKPRDDRKIYRHEYTLDLEFSGVMLRFVDRAPALSFTQRQYLPADNTYTYDGEVEKRVFAPHSTKTAPFQGYIMKTNGEDIRWRLPAAPVLMHFQPLQHYTTQEFLSSGAVAPDHGRVGDVPCIILRRKQKDGTAELWLDVARQYCIRRYLRTYRDVTLTQLDIEYDFNRHPVGIPQSWRRVSFFRTGTLDSTVDARVKTGQINIEIPDDRFDITFPANTWVVDSTELVNGKPKEYEYIARADGTKRIILEEEKERVSTAHELIATETGMAGIEPSFLRRYGVFVLLVAIAILIAAIVMSRRVGRSKSTNGF